MNSKKKTITKKRAVKKSAASGKSAVSKKKSGKPASIHSASYVIRITLQDITPPVWRRFAVSSDMKVADFHKVIQTIMGWTNSHLHHFVKDRKFYVPVEDEFNSDGVVYEKLRVRDLLSREKESIEYEYDFGDGWLHKLVLEKIQAVDRSFHLPFCMEGARHCPPEDCGGPFGYEELVRILKDPANEEYETMREWIGGDFDPEQFEPDRVNNLLKTKDYGVISSAWE